jgi:hypothetical protein
MEAAFYKSSEVALLLFSGRFEYDDFSVSRDDFSVSQETNSLPV